MKKILILSAVLCSTSAFAQESNVSNEKIQACASAEIKSSGYDVTSITKQTTKPTKQQEKDFQLSQQKFMEGMEKCLAK